MSLVLNPRGDNTGFLQQAWIESAETGVLDIPPGHYAATEPHLIHDGADIVRLADGTIPFRPRVIRAWGAYFDQPVVVADLSVSIEGMQVRQSPLHGFVFLRGQGAKHCRLHAEECKGHGFFFGSESLGAGAFGANSQVTLSHFDTLSAQSNEGYGFFIDGSAEVHRNWFNANCLTLPIARGNKRGSFGGSLPTEGPTGLLSRANYNTWIAPHSELNGSPADFESGGSRGSTIIGPHFVEKDRDGNSLLLAQINYLFGGRVVGDIKGKEASTVFANTAAPGEQARFSYDPASDLD